MLVFPQLLIFFDDKKRKKGGKRKKVFATEKKFSAVSFFLLFLTGMSSEQCGFKIRCVGVQSVRYFVLPACSIFKSSARKNQQKNISFILRNCDFLLCDKVSHLTNRWSLAKRIRCIKNYRNLHACASLIKGCI